MAERNKRKTQDQADELTPKQLRLRARQQEHDRKLYLWVGSAIGVAMLLVLAGALYAFAIQPNLTIASVGGQGFTSRQFWNRMRFEKNSMQNQLAQMQQLEQQFGGQGFFTNQINQLQSTLSSNFALAAQTADKLLEERIVAREAEKRGITVTDEEVEKALREEVANQQGLITEPQATETVIADATATADAIATETATAQFTPEATAVVSDTATISETALIVTAPITTTVAVTTAVPVSVTNALTTTIAAVSDTAIAESVEISVSDSLTEAVMAAASEFISPTATAEPIPTRAIITETNYADSLTKLETNLSEVSNISLVDYKAIIRARLLREKLQKIIGEEVTSTEEQVKARHILLREIQPTPTTVITDTTLMTPTPTVTPVPEGFPTPEPTDAPRTFEQAMVEAQALKQRIDAGEDFAALAQEYSDDTGSGAQGGDLGWFGKGRMVPEFEQQAFALEPGKVSEPFTSTFGVHILKLDEKDTAREKDAQQFEQEKSSAYDTWLQEQLAAEDVKRPEDLTSNLPRDLR